MAAVASIRHDHTKAERLEFAGGHGAFFCKQDEPSYIQLAKLDIMQILINSQNLSLVINELRQGFEIKNVRKRCDKATFCIIRY